MITRKRNVFQCLRDQWQALGPRQQAAYDRCYEAWNAFGTQALHWGYEAADEGERYAIRLCCWRYRHRSVAFRRFIEEMGWTRRDIKRRGFEPLDREQAHKARIREGF